MDSGRCFNCLSLGHNVRNYGFSCKCRKCRADYSIKHATALHDCHRSPLPATGNSGVAELTRSIPEQSSSTKQVEPMNPVVRKIDTVDKRVVLLRTCAVRVLNPATGKSTSAFAQFDTASQATLISENLRDELKLTLKTNSCTSIRTIAEISVSCKNLTDFDIESISSGERFNVKNALVIRNFIDDENTLPHKVDTSKLEHFSDIGIPVIPYRRSIDILVGQSDKTLLTVLEEREGYDPDQPNCVFTRLGPIASGGRLDVCFNLIQSRKVDIGPKPFDWDELDELRKKHAILRQRLRELELLDESMYTFEE